MAEEPKRRPRRVPLSQEELAHVIAVKRWREFKKRERFKHSKEFKILNVFNIACLFIYFELLFCYAGPCHYQQHCADKLVPHYATSYTASGKPITEDLDVYGLDGNMYTFVIRDFITLPPKHVKFFVGKDYLLQKKLKGIFENSDVSYRLFSASPILFLCIFVTVISLFAFTCDMNEKAYSLNALTVLNFLTFSGILCI